MSLWPENLSAAPASPVIPTGTERQLAALIVSKPDDVRAEITLYEQSDGTWSVLLQLRDANQLHAHYWLASTRQPELIRAFRDPGAAINAMRSLAETAYPTQDLMPDFVLQCRPRA